MDSFREFYTREQIREIWRQAFVADQERKMEVTITAQNFGEGTASGEISGHPADLMRAAKVAMDELDAVAAGDVLQAGGASHVNFSKRVVET